MWSYLFYIEYLDETEEENYNYLEYYVNSLVEDHSINWFPIKRARCLMTTEHDIHKELAEIKMQLQMYVHGCQQAAWPQRS